MTHTVLATVTSVEAPGVDAGDGVCGGPMPKCSLGLGGGDTAGHPLSHGAVLVIQRLVLNPLYLKITQNKYYTFIERERERNVLFNDALNTFYLQLYGIRHMVKDHSDSEKGNPLLPHRLLLSINSKGSLICTIPQTG